MTSDHVLLINPDALYWARLREGLPLREQEALRYAFEPWLPVALDEVEVRFAVDSTGEILACGIEHTALQKLIDEHPGPAESVHPRTMPEWYEGAGQNAARLEFRTGAYMSPNASRAIDRLRIASCVISLIMVVLLFVGIERRRVTVINQSIAYETAASQRATDAIGTDVVTRAGIDPLLMLTAEFRRLSLVKVTGQGIERPEAVSRDLITLLAAWPVVIPVRVDALDFSAGGISIKGQLRESGDFDELRAQILAADSTWTESASDLTRAQRGFNFVITIESIGRDGAL